MPTLSPDVHGSPHFIARDSHPELPFNARDVAWSWVDGGLAGRPDRPFPGATLVVNVVGRISLEVWTVLVPVQHAPDGGRVLRGNGFWGFPTFSTASLAGVCLDQVDRASMAALNVVGTLGLAAAAAAAGRGRPLAAV